MSIRKRGPNSYQIRVYAGVDSSGRDLYAYDSVKGSFRDAKAAEVRLAASVGSFKGSPDVRNMTVAEYAQRWMALYVLPTAAPKTIAIYNSWLDKAIIPALGNIKLLSLTTDHIQAFVNEQTARANRFSPEGQRVKSNTVRAVHRILSAMMNRAVMSGVLHFNPCKAVVLPRSDQKKVRSMTIYEARSFLAVAKGSKYADLFFTALMTGLRLGELLSLRWSDVDFTSGLLSVTKGGSRKGLTKTPAGQRVVALPSALVMRLQALFLEDRARSREVPSWNPDGYVFTAPLGGPILHREYINAELARVMSVAGVDIPGFTFHSLRGCHASLLADAGLPIRAIADRLGHSDPSMTMRLYIKTDGVQDRVRNLLDTIVEPAENGPN